MKERILLFVVAALIVCFVSCSHQDSEESAGEANAGFFAMNTYISMTAYGDQADSVLEEAESRMKELEALWSVTEENSDIYAVNHSNGSPVTVSDETAEILSFALEMAAETNGALDPTIYPLVSAWGFTTEEHHIPSDDKIQEMLSLVGYEKIRLDENQVQLPPNMMLDLGALGKGYAGDTVIQLLKDRGILSALVDLGGNIQTIGMRPDGMPWRLGLQDPFGGENLGVLSVSDCAVVTSGNYENYFIGEDGKTYGHIIDPVTGYPVESDLASVTVIAAEGKLCDALSTSLFVMGQDRAVNFWRQRQDFEMILVTSTGEISVTEGIADQFSPADNEEVDVIYR